MKEGVEVHRKYYTKEIQPPTCTRRYSRTAPRASFPASSCCAFTSRKRKEKGSQRHQRKAHHAAHATRSPRNTQQHTPLSQVAWIEFQIFMYAITHTNIRNAQPHSARRHATIWKAIHPILQSQSSHTCRYFLLHVLEFYVKGKQKKRKFKTKIKKEKRLPNHLLVLSEKKGKGQEL